MSFTSSSSSSLFPLTFRLWVKIAAEILLISPVSCYMPLSIRAIRNDYEFYVVENNTFCSAINPTATHRNRILHINMQGEQEQELQHFESIPFPFEVAQKRRIVIYDAIGLLDATLLPISCIYWYVTYAEIKLWNYYIFSFRTERKEKSLFEFIFIQMLSFLLPAEQVSINCCCAYYTYEIFFYIFFDTFSSFPHMYK